MNETTRLKLLEEKIKYAGFFRSKVVEVDIDDNDYGAVRLFIPDLMTDKDPGYNEETMGVIAHPGNNPLGGRNTKDIGVQSYYQGTVYVPNRGSWVWCFFEKCNPNKAFYFSGIDIENTKLPPENRNVTSPHKVYTILKTHAGRTVCVSDSTDVERVEITGKKRTLSGLDPAGNDESTYTIDGNQTTILLDERDGKEKLLIKSHKGDFIHFDIDDRRLQVYFNKELIIQNDDEMHWQTDGDIHFKCNKNIYLEAANDIHFKAGGNMHFQTDKQYHLKSTESMFFESGEAFHQTTADIHRVKSGAKMSIKSDATIGVDGTEVWINSGVADVANSSVNATLPAPKSPKGDRDDTNQPD